MIVDLALLPSAAVAEIDRTRDHTDKPMRIDIAEKHLQFFRATLAGDRVVLIRLQGISATGTLDGRDIDQELSDQLWATIQRLADGAMLKSGAISSSALGVVRIHSLHVRSGPE